MSTRLPTHLIVSALLRGTDLRGGHAAVLARGDRESGGLVLLCRTRGALGRLLEQARDFDGNAMLRQAGPESPDEEAAAAWIARRRASDPDLWIVELDVADAERFAAETIGSP